MPLDYPYFFFKLMGVESNGERIWCRVDQLSSVALSAFLACALAALCCVSWSPFCGIGSSQPAGVINLSDCVFVREVGRDRRKKKTGLCVE